MRSQAHPKRSTEYKLNPLAPRRRTRRAAIVAAVASIAAVLVVSIARIAGAASSTYQDYNTGGTPFNVTMLQRDDSFADVADAYSTNGDTVNLNYRTQAIGAPQRAEPHGDPKRSVSLGDGGSLLPQLPGQRRTGRRATTTPAPTSTSSRRGRTPSWSTSRALPAARRPRAPPRLRPPRLRPTRPSERRPRTTAASTGTPRALASYNRGVKLVRDAGGVTVTVLDDAMQRAPAFGLDSARAARDFGRWVDDNLDELRERAEAKTGPPAQHRAVRREPLPLPALQLHDRRRAGQNMPGKATAAASSGSARATAGSDYFQYEANFATDKKSSRVNTLHTRGKRVVAEVTIPEGSCSATSTRTPSASTARARSPASAASWPAPSTRLALAERDRVDVHRHGTGRGQPRRVLDRGGRTPSSYPTAPTTTRSPSRR